MSLVIKMGDEIRMDNNSCEYLDRCKKCNLTSEYSICDKFQRYIMEERVGRIRAAEGEDYINFMEQYGGNLDE